MRPLLLSLIGISCLTASFVAPAFGQQGAPAKQAETAEQKSLKEVKLKVEWIANRSTQQNAKTVETESVTINAIEGMTTMSTNPVVGDNSLYRRVVVRPESQKDGSYMLNMSISEFQKDAERELPRVETNVRVRTGDTKVIQTRAAKGSGYEYEFLVTVTPLAE